MTLAATAECHDQEAPSAIALRALVFSQSSLTSLARSLLRAAAASLPVRVGAKERGLSAGLMAPALEHLRQRLWHDNLDEKRLWQIMVAPNL